MSWIAVGVAVVGGVAQHQSARRGANASQQGTQMSIDEQRRQFDLTRGDQKPFMDAGHNALARMQALNDGNFSQFYESPDYKFAMEQGIQGLDRGAAARGRLYSGGADADRMKFSSGLASQNYNSFYNRLQSMAGQGQTTASGLGSLGMGMANNIGNLHMGNAANRASSYQQQGDAWGQTAAGIGGMVNNWYQNNSARNGGGTGWYMGNNPGKG